jgi:hypothetical protein
MNPTHVTRKYVLVEVSVTIRAIGRARYGLAGIDVHVVLPNAPLTLCQVGNEGSVW